jgi:hypothetical protein
MPEQKPATPPSKNDPELVRRVAERVWQLWREEMRRERERKSRERRS